MTSIYDSKISLYDNLDCLEDEANVDEIKHYTDFDSNDLNKAKVLVSELDDDLSEIEGELDNLRDRYNDDELTFTDIKEFLEDDLADIIKKIIAVRVRLY